MNNSKLKKIKIYQITLLKDSIITKQCYLFFIITIKTNNKQPKQISININILSFMIIDSCFTEYNC